MKWQRRSLLATAALAAGAGTAAGNSLNVPLVPVGDAGNAPDPLTGLGAVSYNYSIGEYDVTAGQYTTFLNAVAATDPYGLYDSVNMPLANTPGAYGSCGITRGGSLGSYTYSVTPANASLPINYITFGDAARFCNWLTNGQPTTGAETAATTETGSYTLNGAVSDPALQAVTRSVNAVYVLPSINEWNKAAYYDGATSTYWQYPTQSNTAPVAEAPPGSGGPSGSANYNCATYDLTNVGAYTSSPGHYGTYDMGGLLYQWTDTNFTDAFGDVGFGLCGSAYDMGLTSGYDAADYSAVNPLASTSSIFAWDPDPDSGASGDYFEGLRIAEVPEPASLSLLVIGSGMLLSRRRRSQ